MNNNTAITRDNKAVKLKIEELLTGDMFKNMHELAKLCHSLDSISNLVAFDAHSYELPVVPLSCLLPDTVNMMCTYQSCMDFGELMKNNGLLVTGDKKPCQRSAYTLTFCYTGDVSHYKLVKFSKYTKYIVKFIISTGGESFYIENPYSNNILVDAIKLEIRQAVYAQLCSINDSVNNIRKDILTHIARLGDVNVHPPDDDAMLPNETLVWIDNLTKRKLRLVEATQLKTYSELQRLFIQPLIKELFPKLNRHVERRYYPHLYNDGNILIKMKCIRDDVSDIGYTLTFIVNDAQTDRKLYSMEIDLEDRHRPVHTVWLKTTSVEDVTWEQIAEFDDCCQIEYVNENNMPINTTKRLDYAQTLLALVPRLTENLREHIEELDNIGY